MSIATSKELFDCYFDPLADQETFVFVGCVHAITDQFLWLMERVADNPPHYLIFCGDVTGSEEFEKVKTLFYERVFNRAHNQLGIGTKDEKQMTDAELLSYVGQCPTNPDQTLREGLIELVAYTYELRYNLRPFDALSTAESMSDDEIATAIRDVANRDYFGSWHKALHFDVRQATNKGIEAEAQKLVTALKPIEQAGTKIVMVGGNWDDKDSNQKDNWGSDIDVFDTVSFFRQKGITFFDVIGTIETDKAVISCLPYWEMARTNPGVDNRRDDACRKSDFARQAGKTNIFVAHGEPDWEVHYPKTPIPSQEARRTVIERHGQFLREFRPDELIYPHQHNPFSKPDGKLRPSRTKYKLRPTSAGVELIRDPAESNESSLITASYLPFQRLGILNIPLSSNPLLKPVGDREPIQVF